VLRPLSHISTTSIWPARKTGYFSELKAKQSITNYQHRKINRRLAEEEILHDHPEPVAQQ